MNFTSSACGLCAAAMLSGCGGGLQSPQTGDARSAAFAAIAGERPASQSDRRRTWMQADAKTASDLLYVSDAGTFDVDVYRFPSLTFTGRITGFDEPQGECSDAAGNVWIANSLSNDMVEFAHGGKSPIATLYDSVGYPVGCAIDPTNGNLAVTNLDDFSGAGSVLVYKNARGTPRTYAAPNLYYYYFDGYDRKGDLYVSGATTAQSYGLVVLPRNKSSMSLVSVKGGKIYFPGTVAWVGSTLVLGDQKCKNSARSCFYELSVSGQRARIRAMTALKGACDVAEAWVAPTQLAGGNYEYCGNGRSSADVWRYPAGGSPTAEATGLQLPIGATLSTR
jgi:hypothetical protein